MKENMEPLEEEEEEDAAVEDAIELPTKKHVMSCLKSIRDVMDIKGLDNVHSEFYELEKVIIESYASNVKQTKISDYFQ